MVFHIASEVGQLNRVILHRPGKEMNRLTPSNKDELLFDDVLWLERGQEEHDAFAQGLRDNGVEVFYLQDLLAEALENPEARKYVSDETFEEKFYGITGNQIMREYADSLSPKELADLLVVGITKREFFDIAGKQTAAYFARVSDDFMLLRCLPNHLFTRDTSCWIQNGVAVNSMQKVARQRETVNYQAIYRWHPMFKDEKFEHWAGGLDDGPATLEGGDVEVIGNGAVLVGISERTTVAGFERLARRLLTTDSGVKTMVGLMLVEERAQMHLDTIMTMVNENTFLKYKHMGMLPSVTMTAKNGELEIEQHPGEDMHKVIAQALDLPEIRVLTTPEDNLSAERGQWNDACNVLTIRPNVVSAYDRNVDAIEYLRSEGVEVVVTPGAELGRGRGGPRCMSCPIERELLK
ncbi:MAG: arginine deiminase [Actinomycetaceae bacterium]|nr:arginine deiminase [Actinomycetaceae bacterium]